MEELFKRFQIEPVIAQIALSAGRINGQLQAKGVAVSTADLLIGATAIELGYSVLTHNIRHFNRIPGLEVNLHP